MGSRRVLVLATVATGALEAAAGTYLLAATEATRIGLFLCISGVCTGLLAIALRALIAPRPENGQDEHRDGGGGEPEPPWWPEFERDFRAWVERSDRPRHSPAER